LKESGLVIEPQSAGSQTHTGTYKIGIGTAQAGTYDITISIDQLDDVNVSVVVLPAKEITATTSGQLQYGNTNKTATITVSAHDGATLPSGTPTLAGFTFTAFNPINEFQAQTTVR
jgi:hypothetical protein